MIPLIISALVLALAYMGLCRGVTHRRRTRLANEAKKPEKPDYKALHAEAIGIPADKAKDMSDEDQLAAHKAHMAQVEKLANDEEDMPDGPAEEVAAANAKVTEAETKLANETKAHELALANEKQAAIDALANERKAYATDLIAHAIEAGRIKPADKATWEADFVKDFDGTKTKLANAKATVIKTKPVTTDAGARNAGADAALANEKARSLKVQALTNAKMTELNSKDYTACFNLVMKENPALFEEMQQPEPKK